MIQNDWLMVQPTNYTFTVQTVIYAPEGWHSTSPALQQIQMDFTEAYGPTIVKDVDFETYKTDWHPENFETISAKVWVIGLNLVVQCYQSEGGKKN